MKEDVKRKMVFIGGPRQSGKTTLAKHLCEQAGFDVKKRYLTWDDAEDRENMIRERFPTSAGFLILDEIHKYSRWRQVVKGLKEGIRICSFHLFLKDLVLRRFPGEPQFRKHILILAE